MTNTVIELDALGLRCPLPVLRLGKALRVAGQGAVVRIAADDPMAQVDIPHFCAEAGHRLIASDEEGGRFLFTVQKG